MGLALWLSPFHDDEVEDLGGLINDLANEFDALKFGPHVTLLSGIPSSAPVSSVLDSLSSAIATWRTTHRPPLRLSFRELGTKADEQNFFQYLFAKISPDEPLLALRKAVRDALLPEVAVRQPEDDYFPHHSLMYGVDNEKRRAKDIVQRLVEDGTMRTIEGGWHALKGQEGIEVKEVQVWMCEGKPEEWKLVGRLDEKAGRHRFIIADLDETHVLISPDAVERVKDELEEALEANHWNPLAVEDQ
ncbi:General transcription and DNA repair factor IIH subunit TFB5 [Rhodotorula toruloides]|nr:General transcription and DNA repair factor IIH subunit TFB5 [Rhodotorula toruloides]